MEFVRKFGTSRRVNTLTDGARDGGDATSSVGDLRWLAGAAPKWAEDNFIEDEERKDAAGITRERARAESYCSLDASKTQ